MAMSRVTLLNQDAAQCRLADFRKALGMFTGRWKLEILWLLYQRNYPVSELRRAMPNITQPVLTAKLQELEADGLVKRTIYEKTPLRVEYEMTPGARQFRSFVYGVMKWARQKVLTQGQGRCQTDSEESTALPRV
jgi:DNA-binding HxlR family transcriptional regulator